jgi:hypothetical protein
MPARIRLIDYFGYTLSEPVKYSGASERVPQAVPI